MSKYQIERATGNVATSSLSVGPKPLSVEDLSLEPTSRAFLEQFSKGESPNLAEETLPEFRAMAAEMQLQNTCAIPEGVEINNNVIAGRNGGVPIRIYHAPQAGKKVLPRPIICFFHGGGWVIGGLDEYDGMCGYLAKYGDAIFVSVDYRLAPEHKFPAALEDCVDAVAWVFENAAHLGGHPKGIGVAGDSAGGNLAAAVTHEWRKKAHLLLARQILLYPCLIGEDAHDFASRIYFGGDDHFLNNQSYKKMCSLYRRCAEDACDPRFAPLLNQDFAGLPESYIMTAEFDMLKDEALAYGARLREAGVPVTAYDMAGTIHGFLGFANALEPARLGLDSISDYIAIWGQDLEGHLPKIPLQG